METRKISEGAIVLATFAIMLLIFAYVPIIGTLFSIVLPVPFIYYTAKYGWKSGLLFLVGALLITIIIGSFINLPATILFGATGFVFGWFIHIEKDRLSTFIAATLTFLIVFTGIFAASIVFFEMNFIEELQLMVDESIQRSVNLLEMVGQPISQDIIQMFQETFEIFLILIPTLFVLLSALIVLLIQLVSFPIIQRFGIKVLDAKPFRELSLPKSFIWYFLVVLILSFFITEDQKGTFLYNAILNLVYIIQMLFIFQGFTFIFYYFHEKKASKAIPILITIFSFLLPVVLQIVRILGIIDLGFDLRKRLTGKKM